METLAPENIKTHMETLAPQYFHSTYSVFRKAQDELAIDQNNCMANVATVVLIGKEIRFC